MPISRTINWEQAPVALSNLENYMRFVEPDEGTQDNLLQLLKATTIAVENAIGQVIVPSAYSIVVPFAYTIRLGVYPITSITSVSLDGTAIGPSLYLLVDDVLTLDGSLSGTTLTIALEAGMPDCPEDVRTCIMAKANYMYENNGDPSHQYATYADYLLMPYRRLK